VPAASRSSSYAAEVEGGGITQPSIGITQRWGGGKSSESALIESGGVNVLVTPESGKAITLYWIALWASQENSAEVLASVKLGSKTPYKAFLSNPGAFAHWEPVLAEANAALIVELSGAQKVAVSWTYSEG
jgi:hypothetical protein